MYALRQVDGPGDYVLMDLLQTLANGCSVNHSASCITLVILWTVTVIGLTNILCAIFTRGVISIEEEEKEEKK